MRITMLQDMVASPDDEMNRYGYEAGQTYTTSNPLDYATHPLPISEALAARFMADGLAVDAEAPTAQAPEAPTPTKEHAAQE